MFTQKKNQHWMWAKSHRENMRKRLYDTDRDIDPNTPEHSWIWQWSHNCNIGYNSLGVFNRIEERKVYATPLGNKPYVKTWYNELHMMKAFTFVVLTDEEKQFVKDYILVKSEIDTNTN
jgi:hypothetical protein